MVRIYDLPFYRSWPPKLQLGTTLNSLSKNPKNLHFSLINPKLNKSMAETETQNEPTLPTKRKLDEDPFPENKQENHTNKSQKLESLTNQSPNTQEKTTDRTQTLEVSFNNQNDTVQEVVEEEEDGDNEADDYEDEEENGEEVVVDRKGKGILIEEDGEDDSGDDDDSSELDGGDDSEEAEEDDPLAEVDLDNILPSRTRRKAVHPGAYIANDNHVDDDDDSDDFDA
ncbi:hypothetical protein SADUNF_Sadunf17G0057800 [Salix dunnii]|uniref:Histone chaperone domain-containing protein n=1 Tax=Salix dunnii TaxID=1413687 RepID=A0A835J4R3_9ROSI|nr:hypothetical protein SADUNF_Sadunf17G0057800 [Salix dunnii]